MSKANNKNIRAKIYKKASQYLFNYGLKGWNMDQLAAETGMAKNTLYKIIGYKEDMVKEIYLKNIKSIEKNLKIIINKEEKYFDKFFELDTIIINLVRYTESRQAREVFLEYPEVENEVRKIKERINKKIMEFLKLGIKNKYLKNNKEADFYFDLILSFGFYYVKEKNIQNEKELFRKSLENLINGIRKNRNII
ncbi:MAG: TetR/AcrR family transcriptional regulator [Bacillota bacterium]